MDNLTCPPCPATHPTYPGDCRCMAALLGEQARARIIYTNNTAIDRRNEQPAKSAQGEK